MAASRQTDKRSCHGKGVGVCDPQKVKHGEIRRYIYMYICIKKRPKTEHADFHRVRARFLKLALILVSFDLYGTSPYQDASTGAESWSEHIVASF